MKSVFFSALMLAGMLNLWSQNPRKMPQDSVQRSTQEALLILPGFGSKLYGTRHIHKAFKDCEYELFIPRYISRKSVKESVKILEKFIADNHLMQYKKLHILSYIFGSWAINLWIQKNGKGNIKTIIYDRSPLQERADYVMIEKIPGITHLLFGNTLDEFLNFPYPEINEPELIKGLFIETYATKLINKYKDKSAELGPYNFQPEAFGPDFTDYCYLPLNHDEMYQKTDVFSNEVLQFIRLHRFSSEIKKQGPVPDPFVKFAKP